MALKFRRGTTAQKSGSLAFGEPYVNTTLGTLQIGGDAGDITLSAVGTGSNLIVNDITASGNLLVNGNATIGGKLTIGDATSDTVTVVASLSSSLIPEAANTYDLGSATKFWKDLYISTGSIKFVDNSGTVVGTLTGNASGDLVVTGQISGSAIVGLGNATLFSQSVDSRLDAVEPISASAAAALNNLSSSAYSTFVKLSGGNTFTGTQTITGSLYVSQNLIVQGSSSLQNITASAVSIGTNTIVLNTDSPSVRYGGIKVIDSGSSAATGSLLWDSENNVWIYTNPAGAGYASARLIAGPQNTGSIGNEPGLTVGYVTVALGDDHIGDSIISASTTKVTIAGGLDVTGNVSASTLSGIGNVTAYSTSVASRINTIETTYATSASIASATATSISTLSGSVFTTYAKLAGANTFTGNQTITGSLTATTTVNAASALINGYLEIKTGTDVNSVKIGRNTGGSATRTVAIGYGAGNAGGSYNVAIGDQASIQLAGSSNTVVGATTLQQTINASSNTVVGANISNAVAIGNTNTLIGAGISLGLNSANNTILGASVSQSVLTDNIILANGSGAIKFRFDGTNNILNNNSVVSGSLTVTGSISAGGDIVAYSTSDKRHKNNIVLISDALSKVTKLNGVTWEWNDDVDAVTKQSPKTGLIAQEVQSVLPEVVTERENGFLGLDYSKMMGLLVEAIKEQQQQIHSLTLEIEKLKKSNSL